MPVYSCMKCTAPKRHPGCHSQCPEYLAEKAEHDRLKALHDQERDIGVGIYYNRYDKVYKAWRYRRSKKM